MQLFGIPLSDAPPRVALKGGRVDLGRMQSRAALYALGTAAFTVSYTPVDGVGARLAGTASGFALWMFAGDAWECQAERALGAGSGMTAFESEARECCRSFGMEPTIYAARLAR
jgi:hypothetical protein